MESLVAILGTISMLSALIMVGVQLLFRPTVTSPRYKSLPYSLSASGCDGGNCYSEVTRRNHEQKFIPWLEQDNSRKKFYLRLIIWSLELIVFQRAGNSDGLQQCFKNLNACILRLMASSSCRFPSQVFLAPSEAVLCSPMYVYSVMLVLSEPIIIWSLTEKIRLKPNPHDFTWSSFRVVRKHNTLFPWDLYCWQQLSLVNTYCFRRRVDYPFSNQHVHRVF